MSWCQFKTAYLLDVNSPLTDNIENVFDYNWEAILPKGWKLTKTEKSGAAGYVLIFEIDKVPTDIERQLVETAIKTMEKIV